MKDKKYSIAVIIPAYNEEQGIEDVILCNRKTFQELDIDYEIIIIDDNSLDKTRDVAISLAGRYPNIQIFHHEKNQGSGEAFKTGITHATKDYVIFAPVDNPLEPEDLMAYLPRIDICDIVVGFRIERVGYSRFASFVSFTYNRILVPLLFNIGVGDVNWIQVYRRSLFTENVISFDSKSLFWLVELLVCARRKRLIVAEVPARMKKRVYGRPTCTRFTVMLRTFIEMIKYFLKIRNEAKIP